MDRPPSQEQKDVSELLDIPASLVSRVTTALFTPRLDEEFREPSPFQAPQLLHPRTWIKFKDGGGHILATSHLESDSSHKINALPTKEDETSQTR